MKSKMESQSTSVDTRKKIMDAALKLFSENGFHATTTRVIAQFAGVNEVTLFRLFKSKQQLYYEILEHVKSVGFDASRLDEHNDLGPEESIRFLIDNLLETMEEHPKEFKIMIYAIMDEVEEIEHEFIGVHQIKMYEFLEKAFIQLAEKSDKKSSINPKLHVQILVSSLFGILNDRLLAHSLDIQEWERQEICDYVAKIYLAMV